VPVQYTIGAVARVTRISLDTLRAWERRYAVVTPTRAEGRRLYSEDDINRLILLREAVEQGHAISQAASMSNAELQAIVARRPEAAPRQGTTLDRLMTAVRNYDHVSANEELGRFALLMSPGDLVRQVVLPAMQIAGEEWHHGSMQIAQEHMLSACLRNLMGSMVRLQTPVWNSPTLVFTTPAGELHEFGVLAAALLASGQGLRVAYLGPNLPAEQVVLAARKSGARVVVLGLSQGGSAEASGEIKRLAEAMPLGMELWLAARARPRQPVLARRRTCWSCRT
jgi:MerR family transcriptional regulator, light-induced transcriptional regulator